MAMAIHHLCPQNYAFRLLSMMLDQEQTETLQQTFLGLQIIVGALITGAVGFAFVIFFINDNRQFNDSLDTMALLGVAMGIAMFALSFVAPGFVRKKASRELASVLKGDGDKPSADTLRLFGERLTQSAIVQFALLEGAILANLVFWLVEGSLFSCVIVGIGFVLMIAFFPLPHRSASNIESMLEDARAQG